MEGFEKRKKTAAETSKVSEQYCSNLDNFTDNFSSSENSEKVLSLCENLNSESEESQHIGNTLEEHSSISVVDKNKELARENIIFSLNKVMCRERDFEESRSADDKFELTVSDNYSTVGTKSVFKTRISENYVRELQDKNDSDLKRNETQSYTAHASPSNLEIKESNDTLVDLHAKSTNGRRFKTSVSNYVINNMKPDKYVTVNARRVCIEEDDLIEYAHTPYLNNEIGDCRSGYDIDEGSGRLLTNDSIFCNQDGIENGTEQFLNISDKDNIVYKSVSELENIEDNYKQKQGEERIKSQIDKSKDLDSLVSDEEEQEGSLLTNDLSSNSKIVGNDTEQFLNVSNKDDSLCKSDSELGDIENNEEQIKHVFDEELINMQIDDSKDLDYEEQEDNEMVLGEETKGENNRTEIEITDEESGVENLDSQEDEYEFKDSACYDYLEEPNDITDKIEAYSEDQKEGYQISDSKESTADGDESVRVVNLESDERSAQEIAENANDEEVQDSDMNDEVQDTDVNDEIQDTDEVFCVTLEDIHNTGPPEPPAGRPSAVASDTSVSVAWSSPPYDGGCVLTGYRVEMKAGAEEEWNVVAERCHSLSRVIRGLTTGQTYTFRVRAENIHGASDPSSESIPIKLGYTDEEENEEEMQSQLEPCHVEIQPGDEFLSRYVVHEELGKGRYGVVHKVTDQKTGNTMAAKFVRCIKKQDREKVQEEIDIMNCLRHPKLLQLAAAFENPKDIVMIMEYISGGELFERVVADDFTLTEKDCILFMRQICEGVDYMHKNLVVHLDLKPENIMCRTRTSHQIKLIDFGLAQKLNPDSPVRVLFGTPEFIPPEIINYEPIGVESDMWSVGVICYVLLSGLSPFMGDNDAETFANITRADYDFDDEAFDAITQDAKDFISSLLEKRRDNRLTAKQCLQHKWMTQCDKTMNCVKLCTDKLKKFIIRRKWQKTGNAIRALGRMATLSAASRRNSSASSSSSSPRPSLSSGAASRMSSLNEEESTVQPECNGKSNRVRMCSERSDSGISDCSSINPPPQTCTCPNKELFNKKFSISEETESQTNDTKLSQVNRLNNLSKSKSTTTPKLNTLHSPYLSNSNKNNEGLNGSSSSKVTSDLSPTAKTRTTNRVRVFPESTPPKPTSGTLQKDAKLLQKNENFQKAFAFWKG